MRDLWVGIAAPEGYSIVPLYVDGMMKCICFMVDLFSRNGWKMACCLIYWHRGRLRIGFANTLYDYTTNTRKNQGQSNTGDPLPLPHSIIALCPLFKPSIDRRYMEQLPIHDHNTSSREPSLPKQFLPPAAGPFSRQLCHLSLCFPIVTNTRVATPQRRSGAVSLGAS